MADSSNQEVDGSPFPDVISKNSKSVVHLGSVSSLKDSTQWTKNVSDTSKREVDGSPFPVGNSQSAVHLGNTLKSLEDSTEETEGIDLLQQIFNDNGKFVKDRSDRFRIVYNDDDNLYEIKTCIKRVKINDDDYNSVKEYLANMSQFLEGLKIQKEKRYPFTVIRNHNQQDSIRPSESNSYREDNEYEVMVPNKETPLYEHLEENSAVRIVRDNLTRFKHIRKTRNMHDFRCEEVQAMLTLPNIAPELYVANRDGEYVILHMELIKGKRLDIVPQYIKNGYIWPLCLRIFRDILYAIDILISECNLSHCDIYTKNIIIEVVQEENFRIRLIDYGDACEYTVTNLKNDMTGLVESILTLFTKKKYDADKHKLDTWISNPTIWERYPTRWDTSIFKRALDVKNPESLTKFRNYVEALIIEDRKSNDCHKEIAKLFTKVCSKKEDSNMLYRLLRTDESCIDGLRAKDPDSNTSVFVHVTRGSYGPESRYISTCGSWEAVNYIRSKAKYHGEIVKIHEDKLPSSVKIIDLRYQENRDNYIEYGDEDSIKKFKNFANKYEEVLLDGCVPARCLELL